MRALSFAAGEHFLELEVAEDGDRRSIVGQVMPPPSAAAGRSRGGRGRSAAGWSWPWMQLGRFAADRLARRPRASADGRRVDCREWVVTEWAERSSGRAQLKAWTTTSWRSARPVLADEDHPRRATRCREAR